LIENENYPKISGHEVVCIENSGSFLIYVFNKTIILSSYHRYAYLYYKNKDTFFEDDYPQDAFRLSELAYRILRLFKGEEIIYLADNACDKLNTLLLAIEEEGKDYTEVKKIMEQSNTPIVRGYFDLDVKTLNDRNITEFIFDDLAYLKHIFSIPKSDWNLLFNLIPKLEKNTSNIQTELIEAFQNLGLVFYDLNLERWKKIKQKLIDPLDDYFIEKESCLLELIMLMTVIIRFNEIYKDYFTTCVKSNVVLNCLKGIDRLVKSYSI